MVLSLGIRSESASLAAERYVLWAMIPLTACEFSASSAGGDDAVVQVGDN